MNALEKNLEKFFNNNNIVKNDEFKSYFYQEDDAKKFNIIYDEQNYIYYLPNIPKEKEYIIKEKVEYEILITDSSYDILFFKNKQNSISCILIIIINDIDFKITNENCLEFKNDKFQDINDKEDIITKIKQKIIQYIKSKKENISEKMENILLEGKEYNLLYNKDLIHNEEIKKLCSIVSKVEIKNENYNNITNDIFLNVYEILSPSYKSMLSQKYIEEMPHDLFQVMIKYQDIKFSKDLINMYQNKKSLKNKNNKKPIINENKSNKANKENNINKNNKIIFNLVREVKKEKKKKKFKVVLKQIKVKSENNKKIKIKKNIFQTQIKNDFEIIKPIIENISIQKSNNKKNNMINKKLQIFKCVNNDNKPKKYIFSINK